jgi:hypothetical protein
MRTLPALFLFFWVIPCLRSDKAVPDLKDNDTFLRIEVLPNSRFNLTDMEGVARRFLKDEAKAHRIAVLSVYADRTVAAQEAASCEGSYRQWKLLYDNFQERAPVAAFVLSLRSDAVLWLRTSDGNIHRRVLSGKDPTQFSVEGIPLEILFVSGRTRSRFEGCGTPGAVDPVLYLRSSATLNATFCQRATSWLAARLGAKYIWAQFTNDSWFPCDGRFPLHYPFSPAGPPPSEATFYSLPGFSCSIFCDAEPRCLSSTPTPRPYRPAAH